MSCRYCKQINHHPSCPLAEDLRMFCKCDECGSGIYIGDQYYEIGDRKYCSPCVNAGWSRAEVFDYEMRI